MGKLGTPLSVFPLLPEVPFGFCLESPETVFLSPQFLLLTLEMNVRLHGSPFLYTLVLFLFLLHLLVVILHSTMTTHARRSPSVSGMVCTCGLLHSGWELFSFLIAWLPPFLHCSHCLPCSYVEQALPGLNFLHQ